MSGPLRFHKAEAIFYNGIETKLTDRLIISADTKLCVLYALHDIKAEIEAMIRNWETQDE